MILTALVLLVATQEPAPAPPPPPTISAPAFEMNGNDVVVHAPVLFQTGSATLKLDESKDALGHIASYLKIKSYVSTLRVEVHIGEPALPKVQELTEERALSVAKALVALGVDCHRLVAVGFGASKPVVDGSTPEGKSKNTRVVFSVAALRGHAIGGMPTDGGGKIAAGDVCPKP